MNKLLDYTNRINDQGRSVRELTREEIIDVLDIIADNMIHGKTTMLEANTLLGIRFGLQNSSERRTDYRKNDAELSQAAFELGRRGRMAMTKAQSEASRINGRKGGRPKGSKKKGARIYFMSERKNTLDRNK